MNDHRLNNLAVNKTIPTTRFKNKPPPKRKENRTSALRQAALCRRLGKEIPEEILDTIARVPVKEPPRVSAPAVASAISSLNFTGNHRLTTKPDEEEDKTVEVDFKPMPESLNSILTGKGIHFHHAATGRGSSMAVGGGRPSLSTSQRLSASRQSLAPTTGPFARRTSTRESLPANALSAKKVIPPLTGGKSTKKLSRLDHQPSALIGHPSSSITSAHISDGKEVRARLCFNDSPPSQIPLPVHSTRSTGAVSFSSVSQAASTSMCSPSLSQFQQQRFGMATRSGGGVQKMGLLNSATTSTGGGCRSKARTVGCDERKDLTLYEDFKTISDKTKAILLSSLTIEEIESELMHAQQFARDLLEELKTREEPDKIEEDMTSHRRLRALSMINEGEEEEKEKSAEKQPPPPLKGQRRRSNVRVSAVGGGKERRRSKRRRSTFQVVSKPQQKDSLLFEESREWDSEEEQDTLFEIPQIDTTCELDTPTEDQDLPVRELRSRMVLKPTEDFPLMEDMEADTPTAPKKKKKSGVGRMMQKLFTPSPLDKKKKKKDYPSPVRPPLSHLLPTGMTS